ncbi:MAG: hypothetical protein ACE5IY_04265 [bacterium]
MARHAHIPVIKNRGLVLEKKRKPLLPRKLGWLVVVFALMLLYVWLKVETNLHLAEIRSLETRLDENLQETEKLQAEVVRLSSFDRIQTIAQSIGLTFLPNEQIVEISTE